MLPIRTCVNGEKFAGRVVSGENAHTGKRHAKTRREELPHARVRKVSLRGLTHGNFELALLFPLLHFLLFSTRSNENFCIHTSLYQFSYSAEYENYIRIAS